MWTTSPGPAQSVEASSFISTNSNEYMAKLHLIPQNMGMTLKWDAHAEK